MERNEILSVLMDWLPDSHVGDEPYIDYDESAVSVEYGDALDTDYREDEPIGIALREQRNRLLFDTACALARVPEDLYCTGWTPDKLWYNRSELPAWFWDTVSDVKMDDVEHEYRIYASFIVSQDYERGLWSIAPVLEIGGASFKLPEITLLPWSGKAQLENALLNNYPWRML